MSRHRRIPSPLTVKQRMQKLAFCLIAGALFILIAGWGLVWWLAALADGAFSILHFLAFIVCGLLGVTLLSIADRENVE
ncbi:hypothetical protein [uncultured Bifidobacterium sp.]|uniref:hypothetical protein n=1 Tax=uncultured Bifidobacterium sp. TaxID=165187 RepID=UPI0025E1FAC1|nr:hypothetical protein [uncultured Bifidobacterium sp.]